MIASPSFPLLLGPFVQGVPRVLNVYLNAEDIWHLWLLEVVIAFFYYVNVKISLYL